MRSLGPRMEVAVATTILGVGAVVVAAMHLAWPDPQLPAMAYSVSAGEGGVSDLKPFEIDDVSGGAVELTPGTEGVRQVRLSNPNGVDIIVVKLSAVPGQPVDSGHNKVEGCPSGLLSVAPMDTPVLIPPAGEIQVQMVVRVSDDVPSVCKDLVFPLTYSGHATRG
jgi:hypothetical protein